MNQNNDYIIVTDSTCDLDIETRKKLGLDIIDNYIIVDGKDMHGSIDWGKYYTADEFYGWMKENRNISTSQVPPQDFIDFFGKRLETGKDILYIGCSSAMSSTVNSARIAKDELEEKYPNQKIVIVDSLRCSFGLGIMVLKAFELRDQGKSIEEVAAYTEEHKNNVQQVGTVESLVYLKRAGRIKGMAAIMGTLIGIKPIIIADAVGMNASIEKVRGTKKAYKRCVEYIKETIVNPEDQYIYVAHTNCIDIANEIKRLIMEQINCKGVIFGIVNPSMGNSVGPGMFGAYYVGKKVEYICK